MGLTLLRRSQLSAYPGLSSKKRHVRFQLRQQAAVLGGDFWIEDQSRRHVYRIDGTRSGSRAFMDLENAHGDQLCRVSPRAAPPWAVDLEGPDGGVVAVVPQLRPMLPGQRSTIERLDGPSITLSGSVAGHEYALQRGGRLVAAVSERWFRAPHSFGVQLELGEDPVLLLAISVALDVVAYRARTAGVAARPATRTNESRHA